MSATPPASRTPAAAAAKPTHHLQFQLVTASFAPLTEPRAYKLSWKEAGARGLTTANGSTDEQGLTQRIEVVGRVPVTLELAPQDGGECKLVGTASTRTLDTNPKVRVQLQALTTTTSAPKPANACDQLNVREGKQQIRFEIHNVTRYTSVTSGSSYPNYLKEMPYLIVDAKTQEILGAGGGQDAPVPRMKGDSGRVMTQVTNVDGCDEVGLVLGSATDSAELWRANGGRLILYRTKPKEQGLTTVVIRESAETGSLGPGVDTSDNGTGRLNGEVWKLICRSYTVGDVKRILPGVLDIAVPWPTPMHIDYAVAQGHLEPDRAPAYREAYEARQAQIKAGGKLATKPELPPLAYQCGWDELLRPIYDSVIENATPPNPEVLDIDPKTKKPRVDPTTKKPLKKPQYSDDKYVALVRQGDGKILIRPLGLTLELSGALTGLGEPFAQNAQEVTGLPKGEVLRKTHPYAYLALLESCLTCGVTYVQINCTWRPMIGSVLHKLGDAIDIGRIDNGTDNLRIFAFMNAQVDALADRFTRALNAHRYAAPGLTIYNRDNLPANAPFHDNHLHFTADRLRPLADQDRLATGVVKEGGAP